MDGADSQLADLVADARAIRPDDLPLPGPADGGSDFAAKVQTAERLARESWSAKSEGAENAAWHARWLVADSSDESAIASLAVRRIEAMRLNHFVDAPRDAPAGLKPRGPGLELLQRPGQGVVIAFAHCAPMHAVFYATAAAAARPVFLSDGTRGTRSRWLPGSDGASSRGRVLRVEGQRLGIRWVGGERRYEVFGELLSQGEACLLAADQLGSGEGMLFGCRVRTSTAPARLALETGRPLIVLTAFRRGIEIDIDLSEPLTERGSVAALHQAALSRVEEQLRHDPTQIVKTLLPFAEAADWIAERARLRVAQDSGREEAAALRQALIDAPDGERPAARARLREAKERLRQVRAQSRALTRPEPPPRRPRG